MASQKERMLLAYWRWWNRFEISSEKLTLFRFLFFSVFALDAWLQISHAPRYGGFNVAHFAILDTLPTPSRPLMLNLYLLQAYLGLRIAVGGATKASYWLLAGIFSYGYFISQLNSYQHHYLLALMLVLLALFPWPKKEQAPARTKASNTDPSSSAPLSEAQNNWPIALFITCLSIVYFYASITKLDGKWLDGSTLQFTLNDSWFADFCKSVGWSAAAKLTIAAELLLVVLIQIRRTWAIAMLLGIGMHLSFEFSGLEIGLFSYFMVATYSLFTPQSWIDFFLRQIRKLPFWGTATKEANSSSFFKNQAISLATLALLSGASLLMLFRIPLAPLWPSALLIFAISLYEHLGQGESGASSLWASLHKHIASLALLLLFANYTDTLKDYYRFWGGHERRSGNYQKATELYEKVVEVSPDYAGGYRKLGDLYRRQGRQEEAMTQYQLGLAIDPGDPKLHLGAAAVFHRNRKGEKALYHANQAIKSTGKGRKPPAQAVKIRKYWQDKVQ